MKKNVHSTNFRKIKVREKKNQKSKNADKYIFTYFHLFKLSASTFFFFLEICFSTKNRVTKTEITLFWALFSFLIYNFGNIFSLFCPPPHLSLSRQREETRVNLDLNLKGEFVCVDSPARKTKKKNYQIYL